MFRPQRSVSTVDEARRRAPRYRSVAGSSRVDESLFGETAGQQLLKASSPRARASDASGASGGHGGGGHGGARAPGATTLTEDDIFRLRKGAEIKTAADVAREKEEAEAARKARHAVAEARKDKIRSLEAARVAALPLSQLAREEEEEKAARRALAKTLQGEAQDDMKRINSIYNFAITTAIRERQLAERAAVAVEVKDAERMRELKAELEVLEAQKRADEEEAKLAVERAKYKGLMWGQLEEKKAAEAAARERARAEGVARLAAARDAVVAEEARRKADAAANALKRAANAAENDAAAAAKAARKDAELALEKKAALEAIEIDKARAAALAEADALRKEKERVASLAAGTVEKFYDDRDKRDELVMRRAYEEGVRRERDRALARERAAAAAVAELDAARDAMRAEKELRMAQMIAAEKDEFVRAKAVQDEWLAAEREREAARAAANAAHLAALRAQKDDAAERAKVARAEEVAAERARRAAADAALAELRALRDEKAAALKALGVDSRFTVELLRYDPAKATADKEMVPAMRKADRFVPAAGNKK